MELELYGRVAGVTGGANGIGLACARGLAREGCRVATWDVSAPPVDWGAPSLGLTVEVSDRAAVDEAVKETEAKLGPIMHLVHSAAVTSGKFGFPFTNLEPGAWHHAHGWTRHCQPRGIAAGRRVRSVDHARQSESELVDSSRVSPARENPDASAATSAGG